MTPSCLQWRILTLLNTINFLACSGIAWWSGGDWLLLILVWINATMLVISLRFMTVQCRHEQ